MKLRLLGLYAVIAFADIANAVTIDFNNFAINTELDVVNAAILGEFVAQPVAGLQPHIWDDPYIPNDRTLRTPVDQVNNPDPELVFYFPSAVKSASLYFTGDPDGVFDITVSFYDQAAPIDQLPNLTPVSVKTGEEPIILTYNGTPILSVGMETTGGNLLLLTEISWEEASPVPTPSALYLFGSGLIKSVEMARKNKTV